MPRPRASPPKVTRMTEQEPSNLVSPRASFPQSRIWPQNTQETSHPGSHNQDPNVRIDFGGWVSGRSLRIIPGPGKAATGPLQLAGQPPTPQRPTLPR